MKQINTFLCEEIKLNRVKAYTLINYISTPEELLAFMDEYTKYSKTISNQVKVAIALVLPSYSNTQLTADPKLANLIRLTHPKPRSKQQSELFGILIK